jgi:hypothetical protein
MQHLALKMTPQTSTGKTEPAPGSIGATIVNGFIFSHFA